MNAQPTDGAGRKDDAGKETPQESKNAAKPKRPGDSVGNALRSVYDETVREDIPDEFRDLLSKLG